MAAIPERFELAPVVSDEDVLVAARGFADQVSDAELGLISTALEWAHRNPGWFMVTHEERWGTPEMAQLLEWQEIAADGGAFVDEMSLPEFAYATGLSDTVVRSLIQDAVVMFYRFPRTWARMIAGHVPVWRARFVPRYGRGVPMKVAAYVDRHLDKPGARFTRPQVQRLIDEARLRYVPDEVAAEVAASAEGRKVEIDTRSGAHLGVSDFEGCLELPDAIDLEAAISYGAAKLKDAGSTEPLQVRRAHALGDLARAAQTPRSQEPLELGSERPSWDGKGVPATGVKIYIHLNHTALRCACAKEPDRAAPREEPAPPRTRYGSALEYMVHGPAPAPGPGVTPVPAREFLLPEIEREDDRLGEVARVDGTGMPTVVLDPGVIQRWFTRSSVVDPEAGPKISIRQVVDPHEYVSTEAYEVPERLREAITATHSRTCVFPYCQRTSARSDCDHTTPFGSGGPTCSCNLAPLCRSHHRVKTHGQHHEDHRWTYAHTGSDAYVWFGPNGIRLLRTASGTHVLPGDLFTNRPDDGKITPGVRRPDGTFTGLDENHPAFDVTTDPRGVPHLDSQGHPIAAGREDCISQARAQNAQDPETLRSLTRYAARDVHTKTRWRLARAMIRRALENKEIVRSRPYPDSEFDDPEEPYPDAGPPPF